MSPKFLSLIAGVSALALAGTVQAAEPTHAAAPMQLSAAQMDSVTAAGGKHKGEYKYFKHVKWFGHDHEDDKKYKDKKDDDNDKKFKHKKDDPKKHHAKKDDPKKDDPKKDDPKKHDGKKHDGKKPVAAPAAPASTGVADATATANVIGGVNAVAVTDTTATVTVVGGKLIVSASSSATAAASTN